MAHRNVSLAALLVVLASPVALAQEEGAGNNLSYPAVFTAAPIPLGGSAGLFSFGAVTLGDGFSFGCAKADDTYPNTSCVTAEGQFLSAEDCALEGAPCAGYQIDPIYWQQEAVNAWQAGSLADQGLVFATNVDWADNLESVTWSERSIVRVETTPFTALPTVLAPGIALQRGFRMWHVANQGPDEMWGVHAAAASSPDTYDTRYAIVHAGARLDLTKISGATQPCPTASGTPVAHAAALQWTWTAVDPATGGFGGWSAVEGAPYRLDEVDDLPYTVELNIGGKLIYGYNWNLKRQSMPPSVPKTGWWRLTFYTGYSGSSLFTDTYAIDLSGVVGAGALAPPVLEGAVPPVESATGPLYLPGIDPLNNVTYIDVCIGTTRGGGKGGRQ